MSLAMTARCQESPSQVEELDASLQTLLWAGGYSDKFEMETCLLWKVLKEQSPARAR